LNKLRQNKPKFLDEDEINNEIRKILNYDNDNLFTNDEKDEYGMRRLMNLKNEVEF
jgi:hypothetical protein